MYLDWCSTPAVVQCSTVLTDVVRYYTVLNSTDETQVLYILYHVKREKKCTEISFHNMYGIRGAKEWKGHAAPIYDRT